LRIEGIIWFDEIIEKLEWKHNVQPREVTEVFVNKPEFRFVEKGHRSSENVYAAMGQTNAGRYIIIFFIYKKNKHAFILSARNMTDTERRKYEK
jgi:uncharacterized DUF497 family protein